MTKSDQFTRLLEIIARLRDKNGCPWDRKQTPTGIKKYLLEETNELAEAIEDGDPAHISEEIGDLFYILAMLCEMFREQGHFNADDALQSIIDKMIHRHPHVFAGTPTGNDQELREQWEALKKLEKKKKNPGNK
jgi:uncharacterized protein YabN with tetrapyrrole methylase and pyrophosphatase domain